MNTKTMEGLIGAGANMKLVDTPMRVFKEARRKGDTATMERAMGYASELGSKADEYRAQAEKGTKEEAKEAREKAELEREKAIERRRDERRTLEEQLETRREEHQNSVDRIGETEAVYETPENKTKESTNPADNIVDTVEISEAGMALLNQDMSAAGEKQNSRIII